MNAPAAVAIRPAAGNLDLAAARTLFGEYAASLDFDLDYQGFDQELAGLPGAYAPPAGAILLAEVNGELAGCVALRPLADGICEMKRLYLRPVARGHGVGRRLAEEIIAAARAAGHRRMRLDTVGPVMPAAIGLYRDLGFCEIPAYYDSPIPDTLYFELTL